MLLVTFGTLVGTVWLYIIIPKGFFPTEDTGFIAATTEGASDISFQAMVERQRQVAEIVRKRPGGRLRQFHRRRRRSQSDHQLRPHVHRAQAEARSASDVDGRHPAAAPDAPTPSPA